MDYTNPVFTRNLIYGLASRTEAVEREVGSLQRSVSRVSARLDELENESLVAVERFGFIQSHILAGGNFSLKLGDETAETISSDIYSISFSISEIPYTKRLEAMGVPLNKFDGSTEVEYNVKMPIGVTNRCGLFFNNTGESITFINNTSRASTVIADGHFFRTGQFEITDLGEDLSEHGLNMTASQARADIAELTSQDDGEEGSEAATAPVPTPKHPLLVHGKPVYITFDLARELIAGLGLYSEFGLKFSQEICGVQFARNIGVQINMAAGSGA